MTTTDTKSCIKKNKNKNNTPCKNKTSKIILKGSRIGSAVAAALVCNIDIIVMHNNCTILYNHRKHICV